MKFLGTIFKAATALAMLSAITPAYAADANDYPSHPVRIIIPYTPGGAGDLVVRYVAAELTNKWGKTVVVENRPGGGTVIGASAVAKAEPDGYTLLYTANSHIINAHLMKLPYDAMKSFAPIGTTASAPYLLLLNPSVPANTMGEFLAYAKVNPGKLNFGVQSVGGLTYIAAEQLQAMAGIKMEMVAYKGAAPAMQGILSGDTQVYYDTASTTMPYVKEGKLKAIGVTGPTAYEDIPPVSKTVPGYEIMLWHGLFAPAGTPPAIIDKVSRDVKEIINLPATRERFASLGLNPFPKNAAQFADYLKTEDASYAKIIKEANIKLE
jgi:tripartite-type tricarboxylate transporter receptor subunit TctC